MSDDKRVLVADPIGETGLDLLRKQSGVTVELADGLTVEELTERIRGASALVVRSATQVTRELLAAATELEVVVRAGAGTDNIDVEAATEAGVVVMNTPGGNTNAAAEHTMALMLALARNVPQANSALREGRWERDKYIGWELRGKTLGLVGLGRIGMEVAARAQAFRMKVVAHDPFISREAAAARDIGLLPLDELLASADVISLHLPFTPETRGFMDVARLAAMKPGAVLVNCARGGLVEESDLLHALESGHLAGAALDVFQDEPKPRPDLIAHPLVVATPHLGASTQEAKDSVGIQAARQVLGALAGTSFENAINLPIRDAELMARLQPYLELAEKMGALQIQLVEDGVREVAIDVAGKIEDLAPLRLAYLRGLLAPIVGASVNYVNAAYLAQQRGIRVSEGRSVPAGDYTTLVTTTVVTDSGEHVVRGTVVGRRQPRLVEIDGFHTDVIPTGDLVVCKSQDRPGVIGALGVCCGENGLNISEFRLGKSGPDGDALSVLTLDSSPSPEALEALRRLPNLLWVKRVSL